MQIENWITDVTEDICTNYIHTEDIGVLGTYFGFLDAPLSDTFGTVGDGGIGANFRSSSDE